MGSAADGLPGVVPVNTLELGRSEQAAVAITGMSAYSNGFEIFVTALIHPGRPGFGAETPDGGLLAHEPQISLQLSDGRTVASGRPHGDSEPTGPVLRLRGGGGTSHYRHSRLWAWPLPPSGSLEFVCHWPALGTRDTGVGIDAQLILDAAGRSVRLWPESDS